MEKLEQLRAHIRDLGSVLVCYSGGVDSALVLAVATRELDVAWGMIAVSPSLPVAELEQARELARAIGARLLEGASEEQSDPSYVANGPDRCFHCKSELYRLAERARADLKLDVIVNGTNVDDLGDYRPGLEAARAAGIISPLVACGFNKADVRAAAREIGLEVWDKPAAACLASRIPYGTAVTPERLDQVGRFESGLRALNLQQVRVRYHGDLARIEVDTGDFQHVIARYADVLELGRAAGFVYVTLDLAGYRMGSHNEVLKRLPLVR